MKLDITIFTGKTIIKKESSFETEEDVFSYLNNLHSIYLNDWIIYKYVEEKRDVLDDNRILD